MSARLVLAYLILLTLYLGEELFKISMLNN